ncbi:hypothetical protein D8674_003760 [Pyrus ussuriensis x Pyrus communis]|uniref:Uncharacterized protein n=1 Tax=Pyrus ussuriensis x Pyrus communis TaxID=2448454 RepID=A0A5N5FHY6_9ROSA|nr:hypothetical protein D8674_003760 [Pyrus ussuriensis x Pyrus communis]
MWVNLKERFSSMTKVSIFQLKTELQNIKKRSDSISEYPQKIKDARDHLAAAGIIFEDDDIIVLPLKGLTAEYNTFRCVIRGRENGISIKDFHSQLLAEKATINQSLEFSMSFGTTMVTSTQASKGKALVLGSSSTESNTYGSSSGGGSTQPNSSNNQGYYTSNQNGGYNNGPHNYTGGYNGRYRSNNYRGEGRGKVNYNSRSRFNTPNNHLEILGTPKPYQSTCPDHHFEIPTCQICIHVILIALHHLFNARFIGNLGIHQSNVIRKVILPIKEGLMHILLVPCM